MLEPNLRVRTLSKREDCSLLDGWLRDIKELNSVNTQEVLRVVSWPLSILTLCLFPDLYLMFLPQPNSKQTFQTSGINSSTCSKFLFRLKGIVEEACSPSSSYFPWTPEFSPFILGPYLSVGLKIPDLAFVYIDLLIFQHMILLFWHQTVLLLLLLL